jgi:lysophospholipase L1-like esterase
LDYPFTYRELEEQKMSRFILLVLVLFSPLVSAQISFPEEGYYVGMGDSVAAGTGAQPATNGYVYRLYERGVFGRTNEIEFANAAVRGARSWDLLNHQVPQIICSEPAQRPTVVTITAGANDFFRGDTDVFAIAGRIAEAVNVLLNNPAVAAPVLDPFSGAPCRALDDVTIMVSNYYSIPHPDPAIFNQLDALLQGFDQALRALLAQVPVPGGSVVAVVDLYNPSLDRQGLVLLERHLGLQPPFDFDPHPTNLGHNFIARQFEDVWNELQNQADDIEN